MGGTLKITGLSLLAGATLLLAGLLLVDMGSWRAASPVDSILLDENTARVNNKPAQLNGGALTLTFPKSGTLGVGLRFAQPIKAANYRYLHLSLQQEGGSGYVAIAPRPADPEANRPAFYTLENRHRGSLWINTAELPGWTGELKDVYLSLFGKPGQQVVVDDFSLHAPSPTRRFAALYDDWTFYEPWDRAAMNTHTGVTRVASFYPLILAAGWLLLSVGCYTLYVLAGRGSRAFDWQATGLIFLACWLAIDATWQQRLLYQVLDTREQFSGLSSDEKLRVGPDAKIVAFVEQLREHIPPESRVFVTSDDDYEALRTAYYLYPLNVYWRMRLGLPTSNYIKSGDFITVMNSPEVRYNKRKGILIIPSTGRLPADRVVDERFGELYRVR